MKIGIDARFFRKSTAGLGRYTRGLIEELAKIDKKNEYIVYLTSEDKKEWHVKNPNFKPKIVDIKHYSLSEQTKFLHILNNDKLDLVHFLNFNYPILYKGKFIVTIHDLTILFFPVGSQQKSKIKRFAFKTVMKNAVKNASHIIAISEATKKDVVNQFDVGKQKISVIYEGIDNIYNHKIKNQNTKINKFRKKYDIYKPYLFFLSQWRPHKGLPELIKAFEILREIYKIPQVLIVGGKPNKDFPEIARAINTSGYSKKIIRPGFIDEVDLPLFYALADAFIFPSKYEGFGLPALEAMACGTPVIASNKSCIPEILSNAAEYFNPDSPQNMAKVIKKVIEDEKLKNELVENGLRQIKKYSWAKMASETLRIYNQIINS